MQATKEIFRPQVLKKVIFELRHLPNVKYQEKITDFLAMHSEEFTKIEAMSTNGPFLNYKLTDNEKYKLFIAEWTRIVATFEDHPDYDAIDKAAGEVFFPYVELFKITKLQRLGVRTFFLIPFEESYDKLIDILFRKFYQDASISKIFGKVTDVGAYALELTDSSYNLRLNIGPYTKKEIRRKISEFPSSPDTDFENAVLVDIDTYILNQEVTAKSLTSSFREHLKYSIENSRIKTVQFKELLLS